MSRLLYWKTIGTCSVEVPSSARFVLRFASDSTLASRAGRLAVRHEDDTVHALQDELAAWRCRRPGPGTV